MHEKHGLRFRGNVFHRRNGSPKTIFQTLQSDVARFSNLFSQCLMSFVMPSTWLAPPWPTERFWKHHLDILQLGVPLGSHATSPAGHHSNNLSFSHTTTWRHGPQLSFSHVNEVSSVSMPCCRTPETLLISTEAITQRMKAMFLKLGCERMRKLFDGMGMAAIKLLIKCKVKGKTG